MNKIINVIVWPAKKLYSYAVAANDLLTAPTGIKKGATSTMEFLSKLIGATTGSAGAAKGSVDALEALACQDGVCFVVSCVGVAADGLQIMTSFVPGPNVTVLVTMPVSVGCKVFVWCCKKSKLPWGSC